MAAVLMHHIIDELLNDFNRMKSEFFKQEFEIQNFEIMNHDPNPFRYSLAETK